MIELVGCSKIIEGRLTPAWEDPCGGEDLVGCYEIKNGQLSPVLEEGIGDCVGPFEGCMRISGGALKPVLTLEEYDTLEELREACCGGASSSSGPSSSEPTSSGPSSSEPTSSGPSSSEPTSSGPSSDGPGSSEPASSPPEMVECQCCLSTFGGSLPKYATITITNVSCTWEHSPAGTYIVEFCPGSSTLCTWSTNCGTGWDGKPVEVSLQMGINYRTSLSVKVFNALGNLLCGWSWSTATRCLRSGSNTWGGYPCSSCVINVNWSV